MNTFLKRIYFAGVSLLMASAFVACDDISEKDRFIFVAETPGTPGNPENPGESVTFERVVLIEDYTGQNCVNCPDAHKVIEAMEEQYGDGIVAVSIHGGKMAISQDYTVFGALVGLANPEGEYYNTKFNITSWPKGMINRTGTIYDYASWASVVRTERNRSTDLGINLDADLVAKADAEDTKSVDISIELIPQEDINGMLQVWVLESGIVARQTTMTGRDNNYVHNNVLRAAVNGNDGEAIDLKKDKNETVSYSIDVRYNDKERWNAENLSIVAFVYDADGVHQVAKAKVK